MEQQRLDWRQQFHKPGHPRWVLIAVLMTVLGVGFALRAIQLTSTPTGLHGDEGIVGLEGLRVLREGWIDVYSPSAHGQPSGPLYVAAVTVWLFDNTVVGVRSLAVLFGMLTLGALLFVVRKSFDITTALLATTFLAVMGWHIHYSRIAFPLPSWPFWVVLTAGAIVYAVRTNHIAWWAGAGAMTGLGMYTYNAHPLTMGILGLYVLGYFVLGHRPLGRSSFLRIGAFGLTTLLTLIPMALIAYRDPDLYFHQLRRNSIRDTAEWESLSGPVEHIWYVFRAYGDFWVGVCCNPTVDYVDAAGVTPLLPLPLFPLAILGICIGLYSYRHPLIHIGFLIVLIMPLSTVLTVHGEFRRTLVLTPFLAIFMAIAVVELVRIARRQSMRIAFPLCMTFLVLVIGSGVALDLRNYFSVHAESPVQRWIFAEPIAEASKFMRDLPSDSVVYFFANRWSIDYETRQFLAPDITGEDRSEEFGIFSLEIDPEDGQPVFILIGDYLDHIDELQEVYPGGNVVIGGSTDDPLFIAYILATD